MPTIVSTNAVVTLASEMCLAKIMWTELSSSENTTRSFYVRGASSTVGEVQVICPQIIWSQDSGTVSLFPACVSVLVLEEKPGVRSWCPFCRKPQFLILKCRFWWVVTIFLHWEADEPHHLESQGTALNIACAVRVIGFEILCSYPWNF